MLKRLRTDPEVRRYLGGPANDDDVRRMTPERIVDLRDSFCVTTLHGTAVGTVMFHPYERTGDTQISYTFLPEHWGHGYAREALAAATAWAFDTFTAMPRLVAMTQAANTRSRRLLETSGMTLIDTFEMFEAEQTLYAISRSEHAYRREEPVSAD